MLQVRTVITIDIFQNTLIVVKDNTCDFSNKLHLANILKLQSDVCVQNVRYIKHPGVIIIKV